MFKSYFEDYYVMTQKQWKFLGGVMRTMKHRNLRFCFWGRLSTCNNQLLSRLSGCVCRHYENRYGLEIGFRNIDGGLLLLHPFNITVNSRAILGHNVTLFKGCTVGSVRSGKREGVPVIGNRVTLCVNSTVVGNVKIGDDVLVTANSMVDFDVPNHSVVIGNPGKIYYKENASKDYLTGI